MTRIADHFYTTSKEEYDHVIKNYDYKPEGIACYVFGNRVENTVPLFRTYNTKTGNHFYTTSANERNNVIANFGHASEGIACYVYAAQYPNTIGLYRLYNVQRNDHFYTTSGPEFDESVRTYGYRDEGTACYVNGKQVAHTIPLYRCYRDIDVKSPSTPQPPPPPQLAELVCTATWIQPSEYPLAGTPFTIYFSIVNQGSTASGDFTVRLEYDNNTETVDVTVRSIAPSGYDTVYWNFAGLSQGSHHVYAFIDVNNQVNEVSKTNNIAYHGFEVT